MKRIIVLFFACMLSVSTGVGVWAQDRSEAYYNAHPSEILPDAQAAFRKGEYDRSAELCRLHYVIVGDQRADALRENALACSMLVIEMNAYASVGQIDEAREKAHAILALNPEDKEAQEYMNIPLTGEHEGHEWVDLGLPSGLKWATCNVEASSSDEWGAHYAWGETSTKHYYGNWTTLKYCTDRFGHLFSKYVPLGKPDYWSGSSGPDNKTKLDLSDDAAHQNWGGKWRTPTREEWNELISSCTWTWRDVPGKRGYLVTGKNRNIIFLPAARDSSGSSDFVAGIWGSYWSSTLDMDDPSNACCMGFSYDSYGSGICERFIGLSVRPVTE